MGLYASKSWDDFSATYMKIACLLTQKSVTNFDSLFLLDDLCVSGDRMISGALGV